MTTGNWYGVVLATAGVIAATAAAQDGGQPSGRSPVIRGVSRLVPGAALGRPLPIRQAIETPGAFPNAYRTAGLVPRAGAGAVLPIATVPPPGAVIATSARPVPAAVSEAEDLGDGFASHRTRPPVTPIAVDEPGRVVGMTDVAPPPPGNWKQSYPIDAVPPAFAPEVMEGPSGPAPRLYFGAEYLLWWSKADKAPPLVTTGAPVIAPGFTPGALGNADTVVLQDGHLDPGVRSGGRFTVGWFLDDCGGKALELTGFFLGSRSGRFDASAAQFPVLARPFFNVNEGVEDVELVAFPGINAGRATVSAPSQLWGLELNLICPRCCGCDWRVNWLVGPRFLNLTDSLTITEDVQYFQPVSNFQAGDRVIVQDTFRTKNNFFGGQVGAEGRWLRGRWTVDGRAKLALGVTDQEVAINGTQTFLAGVNTDPRPGGLLAVGSNIGTFRKTNFAVVPEVGVSVGYYATDWMRVSLGYNLLYWSNVVRPGDQIDRGLDVNQIPNFAPPAAVTNEVRPAVPFKTTDYWAQGVTFGLEFNF